MHRITLVALGIATMVGLAATGIALGSGQPELQHSQTLRILQKGNTVQSFLPLNTQQNNSIGDEFVVTGNVVRWQDTIANSTHRIGHLHAVCFATDQPGQSADCSTITFLRDGSITSYGPISFAPGDRTIAAITGGTGKYRNSRGQVIFVNTSSNTEGLIYQLQP